MQYTQDYDEAMPFMNVNVAPPDAFSGAWMHTLQPYIKSYQVYKCPSDTATNPSASNNQSSYGVNACGWNDQISLTYFNESSPSGFYNTGFNNAKYQHLTNRADPE